MDLYCNKLPDRASDSTCKDISSFDDLIVESIIKRAAIRFGIAGTAVPLIVIVLGFSIAWIWRGFRAS